MENLSLEKTKTSFGDITEAIIIGEQLRLRMHANGGDLIKDRRYHLRTFTTCFVGSEAVDWLIKNGEVEDRRTAVRLMRLLQQNNVLHHVCNDHVFKDEVLFYRFRKDDGTFPKYHEARLFYQGREHFKRLASNKENNIFSTATISGTTFDNCFSGKALVDSLTENTSREQFRSNMVKECRELLNFGIIWNVTGSTSFTDSSDVVYMFSPNLTKVKKLSDLSIQMRTRNPSENSYTEESDRKESGSNNYCALCDSDGQDIDHTCQSLEDDDKLSTASIKSVQPRKVTPEELDDVHSPYAKISINIFSDSVGYGFVVRGNSPTYVQTVDPQGPAAAAGIKVRQFIMSVNGHNVLRMDHKQVAKLILQGQGNVSLVLLTHFRDVSK